MGEVSYRAWRCRRRARSRTTGRRRTIGRVRVAYLKPAAHERVDVVDLGAFDVLQAKWVHDDPQAGEFVDAVIVIGIVYMLATLVADLIIAWMNPRARLETGR